MPVRMLDPGNDRADLVSGPWADEPAKLVEYAALDRIATESVSDRTDDDQQQGGQGKNRIVRQGSSLRRTVVVHKRNEAVLDGLREPDHALR